MRLRFRITLIMLVAIALFASIAFAGEQGPTYDVVITSASCSQIVVSYFLNSESSNGADFASITITANGNLVFSSFEDYGPYDDSFAAPLNLPADGSPYTLEVVVFIPRYASGSASTVVECGAAPVDLGRVCFGPGSVAATVFLSPAGIEIYAISPSDAGELVMYFSQEYLKTLPARPSGDAFLIGDSDTYIPIEFYRNSNGYYRVVAGPDTEGKTFECTFGGSCSVERSWIGDANRPTDELVPECAAPIVPTAVPTSTPEPVETQEPTFIR